MILVADMGPQLIVCKNRVEIGVGALGLQGVRNRSLRLLVPGPQKYVK